METGEPEGSYIKMYIPRWVRWIKYWLYIQWFREPRYIHKIRKEYGKPTDMYTFLSKFKQNNNGNTTTNQSSSKRT